jgi:hypothetical protein
VTSDVAALLEIPAGVRALKARRITFVTFEAAGLWLVVGFGTHP